MKRLPLFMSILALMALSASLAYWAVQLFPVAQRPLAAAPPPAAPEVHPEDAARLFGGQVLTVAASNYQLTGVLVARDGRGSAAILATDGKPAQVMPVGVEVLPGVTVKEVHPTYVLLSEAGAVKRVELATAALKAGADAALPAFPAPVVPATPAAAPVQPPSRMSVAPTIISPQPGMPRIR